MADLFTKITAESAGSSPYEFNSVTVGTDNTLAPSNDRGYAGSYSYKYTSGGSASDCYGMKTFSDQDEVYIRGRLYIVSGFNLASTTRYSTALRIDDGSTVLVHLAIRRASADTPDRWMVGGQGLTTTYATTNFSFSAWHKLEIYWKAGTGSDGIVRVWVDDSLIFEATGLALSSYACDRLKVGMTGHTPVSGSIYYLDEIEGMDAIPSSGSVVPRIMQAMNQFNGGM